MNCALLCLVVFLSTSFAANTFVSSARSKRELPLHYDCNPSLTGSCYKGDLIATDIADCEKDSLIVTCDPINDYAFSSVVDVPDVSKHGVNCVPKSGRSITCGATGTDTRCVCDKAVDYKRPEETAFNQCRCQYWPAVDTRMNEPSYCTQYDHGGDSGVHFYTCCNNCIDVDSSCDGRTYQGGGSTGDYCSTCGKNSAQGGGRITYRFSCVSCAQQTSCEKACEGIAKDTPGLCPYWAGCFRGCCLEAGNSRRKREVNETFDFCGDSVCQVGEDHVTCPIDCCPDYNPSDCVPNTCNPDCCLEQRCCIFEPTSTQLQEVVTTGSKSKLTCSPCVMLTVGALGSLLMYIFSY